MFQGMRTWCMNIFYANPYINSLNIEIKGKEEEISLLQKEIQEKKEENTEARKTLEVKEAEIVSTLEKIVALEGEIQEEKKEHAKARKTLEVKEAEIASTLEKIVALEGEIQEEKEEHAKARKTLEVKEAEIVSTLEKIVALEGEIQEEKEEHAEARKTLEVKEAEIVSTLEKIVALEGEIQEEKEEHAEARKTLEVKEAEILDGIEKILDLQEENEKYLTQLNFLSYVLQKNKEENKILQYYDAIYNNDFLPFANNNKTLANEAEIIDNFYQLRNEILKKYNFPFLENKKNIVICGSFSSGKSSFLNSICKLDVDNIKLPVNLEPTTAIPTWIMQSQKTKIQVYTNTGDMKELPISIYNTLHHNFFEGNNIAISSLVSYIVVETKNMKYSNISFIDTPGINSANNVEDKRITEETIQKADSILFIISIDDGSITNENMVLLKTIEKQNKDIYIVLNKADKKHKSEQQNILNNIKEQLEDEKIEILGISLYSSKQHKEYDCATMQLDTFLDIEDVAVNRNTRFIEKINQYLGEYERSIKQEIKTIQTIEKSIHSIDLAITSTALERQCIVPIRTLYEQLGINKGITGKYEEEIKKLENIQKKMITSVSRIFDKI